MPEPRPQFRSSQVLLIQFTRLAQPGWGGIERYASCIVDSLCQTDSRYHSLNFSYSRWSDRVCLNAKKGQRYCGLPSIRLGKAYLPTPWAITFLLRQIIANRSCRHAVIFVHCPDIAGPILGMLAKAIFLLSGVNATLVSFWHADPCGPFFQQSIMSHYLNWFVGLCDRVVTTSPKLRDQSLLLRSVPRVSVLSCCTGSGFLAPSASEPLHRPFDLIFIGRADSYKRLDVFIQAFETSSAQSCLIIGNGTEQHVTRLYSQAHEYKKYGSVVFHQKIDERVKCELLRQSKVLVLPSLSPAEAFGIVQIEAFATSTPVISSRIYGSGVDWVNINGVTGLTVCGSPESFASAIDNLLLNPAYRAELAQNAFLRWKNLFTFSAFSRQLHELKLLDS